VDDLVERARKLRNTFVNQTGKKPNVMFMWEAPDGLEIFGMKVCEGSSYSVGYVPLLSKGGG